MNNERNTTLTDTLRVTPLFESLTDAELARLSGVVERRRFGKGAALFAEGDDADGFHVIVSGYVRVFKLSPEGKEQTLRILDEHEPVGEAAVFAGATYPAHAAALDVCGTVFVPADAFRTLVRDDPGIAMKMLAVLSSRLKRLTGLVEDLTLKEVPARLAAYLLARAEEQDGGAKVCLSIPKNQLANVIGATPESLSRALARLTRSGAIAQDSNRRIRLLDTELLRAVGEGETRLED